VRIIENSPSQLRLRDRTWWISVVCFAAAVFVGVGAAVKHGPAATFWSVPVMVIFGLVFLQATDVTFDAATETCRIRRLGGFRRSVKQVNFADIEDIRIDSRVFNTDGAVMCRLSLVAGGNVTPLSAAYEQRPQRYEAMRSSLVQMVFAGRPQPPESDPVRDLIAAGRRMDAIGVLRRRENISLTEAVRRVDAEADMPA